MDRFRNHVRNIVWTAVAVFTIAASWPPLVQAFNPQPEPPAFGMVGLARLQTARLSLVNLQPPDPQQWVGGVPRVGARLTFLDVTGRPFLDRTGASIGLDVDLEPGASAFVDLRSMDAFRNVTGPRVQFRPLVEFLDDPMMTTPCPCERAVATLEIFDELTGRTMVLYAQPPDPTQPPDPAEPR